MIFSYQEVNRLPVMIIDRFYDNVAQEKIMQELLFLTNHPNKLKTPENTGSAWVDDKSMPDNKRYLKKNKANCLDDIYIDRNISNILVENRKLFTPTVTDELEKSHPIFRYVKYANRDGTLVNYYEDEDYYQPHRDDATITAITFFYKTPKYFDGGDLILEEKLNVECVSNRCVIFPSITLHAVSKIKLDQSQQLLNYGRFSITQFLSYKI